MTAGIFPQPPTVVLAEFVVVLACTAGAVAALLDALPATKTARSAIAPLANRERDLAAGLGWPTRAWLALRVGVTAIGLGLGVMSGIPLLIAVGGLGSFMGVRWAVAGRAAVRRLAMERAFLSELRNLRDRMAVGNQPLDTALQEVGRRPGAGLRHVLEPLARGGSMIDNIVEVGERSRSPVVEYACGVLIWSRTRSLDSLIDVIDSVLLEFGEAQLAIQEELLVTMSQQRAVTLAMSGLLVAMFLAVVRVDLFRAYYATTTGQGVLLMVLLVFAGLVALLGMLLKVRGWTRWDLRKLRREREYLGG